MLRPHAGWLPAAAVATAAVTAAAATATPSSTFRASISGSQTTVVTQSRSTTDEAGCTVRSSAVDRRTLTFASTRSVPLTIDGARFASARLPVAITAAGRSTRATTILPEGCREAAAASARRCGPHRYAGSARIRPGVARGALIVDGSVDRRRNSARCAAIVERTAPFLVRSSGRVAPSALADLGVERITLRGSTQVVDRLASGARVKTTVAWTLVLARTP